jgi:hypothetical protein
MKDISTVKSIDVIKGKPLNKEAAYYSALFGCALIFSMVLLIYGIAKRNSGLITYSAILVPVFLVITIIALRFVAASFNSIYVENETLVIRKFLTAKKIPLADIVRVSVATNNKTDITSVNVTYGDKTAHYTYKNLTKEDVAHLRRATSKH